ncbi:MAG: ATPase [Bacteroidetes bacterium]|nr:MAG: ATPase [Bacteroidota bacterium]
MRIKSIQIEKLFDLFNYEIPLDNSENVVIITGPNGFGKTMILNIIFNIFNRNFEFLRKLVFEKITLKLEDGFSVEIDKILKNIKIKFLLNNKSIGELDFDEINETDLKVTYIKHSSIYKYKNFDESLQNLNEKLNNSISLQDLDFIFDNIKVKIIEEQRLLKKVRIKNRLQIGADKQETTIVNTIETLAESLAKKIFNAIQLSFEKTQELDSSYIDRLIDEKKEISENDYNLRLNVLIKIQKELYEFGINENEQKIRNYSKKDAKALLVYLSDLENKLKVFDDLLTKITLFATILNERRFTYKSIKISKEKGFYFQTSKGKELKLNQLSSGEQHEVVLLYELIFNTKPNVLLLIDEPEISLHIVWQKEFLNDLITIAKLQNIQVVVATHAPAIVNGRWDLTSNLAEIAS